MNEIEKRELNEKLARHFMGVKKVYPSDFHAEVLYIPSGKPWRTHSIDARPLPDFCSSLDAQAKYLWPKLQAIIQIDTYSSEGRCTLIHLRAGESDSPALACAIAVGKLIDSEVESRKG